jgi:hypothetical protein
MPSAMETKIDDQQDFRKEQELEQALQQPATWENSKENFVPVRAGRGRTSILGQPALGPAVTAIADPGDTTVRLKLLTDQRALQDAVDSYKGDDPLEPWLRYMASCRWGLVFRMCGSPLAH